MAARIPHKPSKTAPCSQALQNTKAWMLDFDPDGAASCRAVNGLDRPLGTPYASSFV